MSANKAILLGNVGKDPKITTTKSGKPVAAFPIATSERYTDKATGEKKEQTEWHNIVVFNEAIVGVVEKHVRKGDKVYVEGKIQTRKWQHQDGSDRWSTEIVLGPYNSVLSLEGGPQQKRQTDPEDYGTTTTRPGSEKQTFARDLDDEVPF